MNYITIFNIRFKYDQWELERDGRKVTVVNNLKAIHVNFSYKNISNATMQINTDKELTIEEIKESILIELKG
jgi:Zn-finger protein